MNMKREVAMNIRPTANADPIRINVVFDMSGLSAEQIADWAVSANGVRVWYQNRERPKGIAHLTELSKTTQTVKVPPTGTRVASAPLTETQMMGKILETRLGANFATYIADYDSIEEAFVEYFADLAGSTEKGEEE